MNEFLPPAQSHYLCIWINNTCHTVVHYSSTIYIYLVCLLINHILRYKRFFRKSGVMFFSLRTPTRGIIFAKIGCFLCRTQSSNSYLVSNKQYFTYAVPVLSLLIYVVIEMDCKYSLYLQLVIYFY